MRSVNKVILVGNVGNDPEVRTTAAGVKVAKLSLATNFRRNDGTDETQWHRLTFFDNAAEIADQYIRKGDRLYIEGRIQYSQSGTEDEGIRYWTDIIVGQFVMLGSPNGDAQADEPAPAPEPAKKPAAKPRAPARPRR